MNPTRKMFVMSALLVLLVFTVTEEDVTVPAGTYQTVKIHVQSLLGYGQPILSTWWLDRDLGPVKIDDWELLEVDGPVQTESMAWSQVKQLFR